MKTLAKIAIPILLVFTFIVLGKIQSKFPTEPVNVYAAQVDYFLKIPGIEGESTKQGHGGEIDIESWSWGETNEAALLVPAIQKAREAAGRNDTNAVSQMIMFEMPMSKASPKLMQLSASGKQIEEEVILIGQRATDREPYLLIKMKPVYITSYQSGGSSGDVVPVDTISLNFGSVKFEYKPQNEDGTLGPAEEGTWNFESNTAEYEEDNNEAN